MIVEIGSKHRELVNSSRSLYSTNDYNKIKYGLGHGLSQGNMNAVKVLTDDLIFK